jgi:hypothetical protein
MIDVEVDRIVEPMVDAITDPVSIVIVKSNSHPFGGPPQRPSNNQQQGPFRRPPNQPHMNANNCYRGHDDTNNKPPPPLEQMVRYGYRVAPHPNEFKVSPISNHNRIPHLCLLAISIDDLPYQHIWDHRARSNKCRVSLIGHAKYPDRCKDKRRLLVASPVRGRGKAVWRRQFIRPVVRPGDRLTLPGP